MTLVERGGVFWDWGPLANILRSSYAGNTTSKYYFYMWRFGWVFYIMTLFLAVMAFFAGFLACCGRLGSAISGLVSLSALFFYSIGVSLMTCVPMLYTFFPLFPLSMQCANVLRHVNSAVFVKARDAFRAEGRPAEIGKYAFGFSWGAWAALLIATVLFFMGTRRTDGGGGGGGGSKRTWRRRQSTRSTRSYDLGGGTHRVKDEYP